MVRELTGQFHRLDLITSKLEALEAKRATSVADRRQSKRTVILTTPTSLIDRKGAAQLNPCNPIALHMLNLLNCSM